MRSSPFALELADYAHSLKLSELPESVRSDARKCVQDWIAVSLGGASQPEPKILLRELTQQYGSDGATIMGYGQRMSPLGAALVNGTMAHSLDYDDTILDCAVHPGAVVVTAAVAAAETVGASGALFLEGVVAGYEVMARVGMAIDRVPEKANQARGFHPTGTAGPFGAAAAAARIFQLSARQTANALGIAGSTSSGLLACLEDGSMIKRLHPGLAASNGLKSAMLARSGFTGPGTVFEGRDGFLRAFADVAFPDYLAHGLGSYYYTSRTAFKVYPCCHIIHSGLDAMIALIETHGLRPSDIDQIEVQNPTPGHYIVGEPLLKKHHPETVLDRQMSLPYCIAVAALDGRLTVSQLSADRANRADVRQLITRVTPLGSDALDKDFTADQWPSVVTVRLKSGQQVQQRIDRPTGYPGAPIPRGMWEAKMLSQAKPFLTEGQAMAVLAETNEIENLDSIARLISLLVPAGHSPGGDGLASD